MDLPQTKRQRRASVAARGMPGLPPEVVAAIGGFCCRSSLDALMLTSKQIRDGCKGVSKPWPTNPGCPLVQRLCPDHSNLPERPEDPDYDYDNLWGSGYYEYQESSEFKQYVNDLRSVTPPSRELIMLHDAFGPSFLALGHGGGRALSSSIAQPTLQLWSKEWGLVWYEELSPNDPYENMRMAVTPPLGPCATQFLMLPARRYEPFAVRMVEIVKPSGHCARQTIRSFPLPCQVLINTVKCVGGSDDPCLIFMERGESAVKRCKISFDGGTRPEGGDKNMKQLQLSEPEILVSDPSRRSHGATRRRSSLAVDPERGIIAFSYDMSDTRFNVYDMKRKVSVAVPVPEAGWIRQIEFSPDGKTLVVAHHHYDSSNCALSLYDCDVERIECIAERPPKFVHLQVEEGGYWYDSLAFSPKGTVLSFQWHPISDDTSMRRAFLSLPAPIMAFGRERVGMIDLAPLKDADDDGSTIRFEILSEIAQWERFIRS